MSDQSEVIEIKKELGRISDTLKEHGEKALAEAKKGVEMSTSVKQTVDELMVKQGELQAQVADLEQKAARRAADQDTAAKTAGQLVTASEKFKTAFESGELSRKGGRIEIPISSKAITSANGSAGQGVAPDRRSLVLTGAEQRLTVRDLISPGSTNSNLVQYMKETGFTNNAAPTGEGVRKPESTITYALQQAVVKKIPHFIKASSEILADWPALQSMIDERLTYGLKLIEEGQLMNGSGVGNNLSGLYTNATAYVAPITIASPTRIDVLRLALLQAELALFPATGITLHPSDWAAIELTKTTYGEYIIGNPQATLTPSLWNRPVVTTQALTVNNFLVGAFKLAAQIFDRQDATITVATENEDDFVNNLITILIEERLALAIYRPEALVKGALS